SPESSALGSPTISHGETNAGVCVSGGRAGTRPPTSSRLGADAQCAPSRHTNLRRAGHTENSGIIPILEERVEDRFTGDDHRRKISRNDDTAPASLSPRDAAR